MAEGWRDIPVDDRLFYLNELCFQVLYRMKNFYMALPDLVNPSFVSGDPVVSSGFYRRIVLDVGCMDVVQKEEINPKDHSPLWLNQTPRQFFMTIDDVIREIGAEEDIKKAQKAMVEADRLLKELCDTEPDRMELLDNVGIGEKLAAYPVFCRLLDMGYTEYDLSI